MSTAGKIIMMTICATAYGIISYTLLSINMKPPTKRQQRALAWSCGFLYGSAVVGLLA